MPPPPARDTDPLGALERYACTPNPEAIPPNVHLAHTPATITIRDAFPKSVYHLLVLPRPREGVATVAQLRSLRALMSGDRARARRVLEEMGEAAEAAVAAGDDLVRAAREGRRMNDEGVTWDVMDDRRRRRRNLTLKWMIISVLVEVPMLLRVRRRQPALPMVKQ